MTRKIWGPAALITSALVLFGGMTRAADPSGPDYSQLARTLAEDFPQSKARRAPPSVANFVPDPSIFSKRRSPTLNAVRQTGRVVRVERDHILLQLQPNAKPDDIKTLLEENRLKITGGVLAIGLLDVEVQGQRPKPAAAHDPVQAAMAEDATVIVNDLDRTIRALRRKKYEHVVRAAAPNVLLGTVMLPPPSTCAGKDLRGNVYLYDWRDGDGSPAASGRDGNWGQKLVRFPAAWNFGDAIRRRGGPRIEVGVLDVGFNEHENLDFVLSRVTKPEIRNHGNHVLGIIGAKWDTPGGVRGCTPFAHLSACTIAGISGSEGDIPPIYLGLSDIIASLIEFIRTTEGLKVINVSLGYNWVANERENPNTSVRVHDLVRAHGVIVRSVADLAADKGIIIASAAGNDSDAQGGFADIEAQYASPFNWAALNKGISDAPARNIVVVESIGRSGTISPFSNVKGRLAAPGEEILSTVARADPFNRYEHMPVPPASRPVRNNYAVFDGTSMATPHVTGLIALMYAYNPELKMDEVLGILERTADRERNQDHAPVIDAFAALLECRTDALKDLANIDTEDEKEGGKPKVNMADFRAFKRALKEAGQGDGKVFPRADLNGDGKVSKDDQRMVQGEMLSDLGVMKKVWEDPKVKPEDLDKMLDQ